VRGARRIAAIGVAALAVALVAVPAAGARAKVRQVPAAGVVTLGTVRCAASEACVVEAAPKREMVRVAGKAVRAKVVVPPVLGAGGKGAVKLRFGAGALARLAGHTATFEARALVRGSGKKATFDFKARLRRPAAVVSPTSVPGGGNASPGGGSAPHSEPVSGEAAVFARPVTARNVEDVTLTWYPRDSFVAYLATGTGAEDGVHAAEGATTVESVGSPCPVSPSASAPALPYTVNFAPRESWFDPASGLGAINGGGSVLFRYKAHTIDLVGAEPEIQLNGARSLAIFRFSGSEGTPYPDQRVALESLAIGTPTVTNEGRTYTYSLMRGTLTPDGEKVFAGFYPAPNNGFGCLSASFTLP
jgi:hypothetical protein